MIDKIAADASGSGGEEGGGSDTFLIKVTADQSGGDMTTDVSFDEIVSATTMGKTIKVQVVSPDGDILEAVPIISPYLTSTSPWEPATSVDGLAAVSLNVATTSGGSKEMSLSAIKIRFAEIAAGAPAVMTASSMSGVIDKDVTSS